MKKMASTNKLNTSRRELRNIGLILLLALVHGLLYIALLPPWQHYDEPNHFEYVWMINTFGRLPQADDHDNEFSRELVASLLDNGFYDSSVEVPELPPAGEKLKTPGYSQLAEPPLYFIFASLPLFLVQSASIENQMYAVRLVSLTLFLISILAGWGVAKELTPDGHSLRWMVPLTMALLPGFVDVMTAVNSDAGAVAVFSLFLWGSVRIVKRGFSIADFLWVTVSAGLAYLTKNTAYFALLLYPVVLMFSVFRGRFRRLAWVITGIISATLLAVSITWGDAAYWYRATSQAEPTRLQDVGVVAGDSALQLNTKAEVTPNWLVPVFQPLPAGVGEKLRGKTVTFGFWIWADEPVEITSPILNTPSQNFSQSIEVGREPKFYAFSVKMPEDAERTWVTLSNRFSSKIQAGIIYYDGLVLVEGERPIHEPPQFNSPDGAVGVWGGQPFINLIRNPSGETAWPRVRPIFDDLGARVLPDNTRPSLILTSIIDWSASNFLYINSAQRLFNTFWAWFGWGHIPLMDGNRFLYQFLLLFTFVVGFGTVIGIVRRRRAIRWDIVLILGMSLIFSWGITWLRGPVYLAVPHIYLPVARHAYPSIISVVLVICFGWLEICYRLDNGLRRISKDREGLLAALNRGLPNNLQYIIFFAIFVVLDLLSVVSIGRYYYVS